MRRSIIVGVVALLSAILVYVGKDPFVFHVLIPVKPEHLNYWMTGAFFAGCIFPLIIAPFELIMLKYKQEIREKSVSRLLGILKKSLNNELKLKLNSPEEMAFNVRIFFPVNGFEKAGCRFFKSEKYFKIKKVTELAGDQLPADLVFRVKPEPQGVVGRSYENESMYYDPAPQKNTELYRFDKYQELHTKKSAFVAAAPILSRVKIVAILAIDSPKPLYIAENSKEELALKEIMEQYCILMGDCLTLVKERK